MEPDPTISISGRILAEFVDDAKDCMPTEAEFVPVPIVPRPATQVLSRPGLQDAFSPPIEEAATAAKKFWLKIIRRFTEPVPGKKGRLRARDSAEPNRGRITIECARRSAVKLFSGSELDISDKLCVTLFVNDKPVPSSGHGGGQRWVRESAIPVPWTEVVNIRFKVDRLVGPELKSHEPPVRSEAGASDDRGG
jgi:hypothetical protein